MKTLGIGILLFWGAVSCTAKSGGPPPVATQPTALAIPCDAERVLKAVCQQCHGDPTKNGAPFPIITYADTQVVSNGEAIWRQMHIVVQRGTMPLAPVQIGAADRDTLVLWLNEGAPPRSLSDTCADVTSVSDGGTDTENPAPDAESDEADGDSGSTSIDAGAVVDAGVADSPPEADTLFGDSSPGTPAPDASPSTSD